MYVTSKNNERPSTHVTPIAKSLKMNAKLTIYAVADFNFGTLIRMDASDEYTQNNTIFCTLTPAALTT